MPCELVRQPARAAINRSGRVYHMTVHGRTVWISLAGLLDRAGVQRLQRQVASVLGERNLLIVLDGSRLVHLDYRCVMALVRWKRVLCSFGHRLILSGWNGYLTTILAMEDWGGELEDGFRRSPPMRLTVESLRHVQSS